MCLRTCLMCPCLNEVQFPKELQLNAVLRALEASMKCSSRRNCNYDWGPGWCDDHEPQ